MIQDDSRNGLIMVAAGIGIYIFLTAFISRALGYVGVIPLLVGLAMLLHAGVSTWLTTNEHDGTRIHTPDTSP